MIDLVIYWSSSEYSESGITYGAMSALSWEEFGEECGEYNYIESVSVDEPRRDKVVEKMAEDIDRKVAEKQHSINLLLEKKQQLLAIEAK